MAKSCDMLHLLVYDPISTSTFSITALLAYDFIDLVTYMEGYFTAFCAIDAKLLLLSKL